MYHALCEKVPHQFLSTLSPLNLNVDFPTTVEKIVIMNLTNASHDFVNF